MKMLKQVWLFTIGIFIIHLSSYAQQDIDVFPDFPLVKPSKNNSIIFTKQLANMGTIAKFNLKDTCFDSFVEKGFFYQANQLFDLSINHQTVSKDSICFSVSFKNTSPHGMYVSLAWFMNTLLPKSVNFSTVSDDFGLDCFTCFEMEKINSQEITSEKFVINSSLFDKMYYEIYIVNDANKLVLSSPYQMNFVERIYENELVVNGISDSRIHSYKRLTKISLNHYPINNRFDKVRFEVFSNK